MSIWTVIRNLGVIIPFLKSFEGLIEGVVKSKAAPGVDQVKDLLEKAEALLESGVIDIPGVDEKMISEALKQIEAQLTK